MKTYLFSLGAGLLVGVIYALLQVRSPAPPVIALVGLLGILLGEQLPPLVRHWLAPASVQVPGAFLRQQVQPHVFGELPRCAQAAPPRHPAEAPAADSGARTEARNGADAA